MSENSTGWSKASLADAIKASDAAASFAVVQLEGSDVLEVIVKDAGDFALHVAVGEAQILTSAILWARDEQDDPSAFEAMMLRSHKALLPLCALSIDIIDGREFYELFGAVSCNASLDEITEEFLAIADSAMELARDIGPRGLTTKENAS